MFAWLRSHLPKKSRCNACKSIVRHHIVVYDNRIWHPWCCPRRDH